MRPPSTTNVLSATLLLFASFGFCRMTEAEEIGFADKLYIGGWESVVGVTFSPGGDLFAWEKSGKVWAAIGGIRQSVPVMDLSDEVGNYNDYGMIGLVLDPDFSANGFIYLCYVVDHYHLDHYGDADYDPDANEYQEATIGRVTRYELSWSLDEYRVVKGSRTILIGESKSTGIPLMASTHGPGSIVFGADGTLLISTGDAASPRTVNTGGDVAGSYAPQGLREGILREKEDIGAFRSQMIDSMNGKLLRIDPLTGDGVASNPHFDQAAPRSARSRVWALGFRQPYRMTRRPGTGSSNPSHADPGAIFVGDVGSKNWEELDVVTGPGQNFGWPSWEGFSPHPEFRARGIRNPDAPNPLAGGGCPTYFKFTDLVVSAHLDPSFPNPCDTSLQIPAAIPHFVHTRPVIDWNHDERISRVGRWAASGAGEIVSLDAADSPVTGRAFKGGTSTAGAWYTGDKFPDEFRGSYFHGDFVEHWIRNFVFDEQQNLIEVRQFMPAERVVSLAMNPLNGRLYYVHYPEEIREISFRGCENENPVAVATLGRNYGDSPLAVKFSAARSVDPEGDALNYRWDFGDGSAPSLEINPTHIFVVSNGEPTRFDVELSVSDQSGATNTTFSIVSVNNTPPRIEITSPVQGATYPISGSSVVQLAANIEDDEFSRDALTCAWRTYLHHDDHFHEESIDPSCTTQTVTSPFGCRGEIYYHRFVLTVTDPAGLSTRVERVMQPDCDSGELPPLAALHLGLEPDEVTVRRGAAALYSASVENAGGLPLTAVRFDAGPCDWVRTGGDANGDDVLQADESWSFSCLVAPALESATLTATVRARAPDGAEMVSAASFELIVLDRVREGLMALYTFEEGGGGIVRDVSGSDNPLDLSIADPSAVLWPDEGGLVLDEPTTITSDGPASQLHAAITRSEEFSLEVWLESANRVQAGPARIVTLSVDGYPVGGNFVLAQSRENLAVRLRSTSTDEYGVPAATGLEGRMPRGTSQIVLVRTACQDLRVYIDGALISSSQRPGGFSNWNPASLLSLGNEPDGKRPWSGRLDLVAVYDRALSANEVRRNFSVGSNSPLVELFQRGDCNGDGQFDISDPINTLLHLFTRRSIFTCDDACDVNDDGAIDISDPISALNFQFIGGSMIPAPFFLCGEDQSADELECLSFPSCH